MGLADIHMHTIFSYDGTASVPAVLEQAGRVGLDIIAITDHDEIRGALLAEELAPRFGIQVIPGVEITTAEGDLLALGIRKLVPARLPLLDTIKRVGEQGGFCVAPHPGAAGLGMNSLSAYSIYMALKDYEAERILVGIETYNATTLDRAANHAARSWAERFGITQTGSSDAHVLEAIGLGATEFDGHTIPEFLAALWTGNTRVRRGAEWGPVQVLGRWAASYLMSTPAHMNLVLA